MTVRRFVWRACYGALAKRVPTPDWAFMNYGYAAPAADADTIPRLQPADERDRLCIQLYLHAIDHADLRGKDVLEVGSGRGGGASYIAAICSHGPRRGWTSPRQLWTCATSTAVARV